MTAEIRPVRKRDTEEESVFLRSRPALVFAPLDLVWEGYIWKNQFVFFYIYIYNTSHLTKNLSVKIIYFISLNDNKNKYNI